MKESMKQESTEKISGILRSNTVSRSRVQSISLSMQPSLQVRFKHMFSEINKGACTTMKN